MSAPYRVVRSVFAALALLLTVASTRAQLAAPPAPVVPDGVPTVSHARGGFRQALPRGFVPFGSEGLPSLPHADAPDARPSRGLVYLGRGQTAVLGALRQVTTNTHVSQYAFSPAKPTVVIVGTHTVRGKTVPSLWLCDTRTLSLRPVAVPSVASQAGSQPVPFVLHGWDSTGRFLLVSQDAPLAPPVKETYYTEMRLFRVDTGVATCRVSRVQTPGAFLYSSGNDNTPVASPSGRRVVLYTVNKDTPNDLTVSPWFVYNVAQDKMRRLAPLARVSVAGWNDETHLLFFTGYVQRAHYYVFDIQTGQATPAPRPDPPSEVPTNGICPALPNLVVYAAVLTSRRAEGRVSASINALWICAVNRASDLSEAFVGASPGSDNPQIAWSYEEKQFGFIAHGDLFLRGVSLRHATLEERDTAGDMLTDTERETLATQTITRIRAALNSFTSAGRSPFPSAEDFTIFIVPMLSPDVPLTISRQPFVYHAPPFAMQRDDPTLLNFVLGEFALSHVTVTLYGDGRIMSVPRPHSSGF